MNLTDSARTTPAAAVGIAVFFLVLQIFICSGCKNEESGEVEDIAVQIPHPIAVVFVDLPDVADAIARQWSAERSGTLTTTNVTTRELLAANYSAITDHDIIVYPGHLLGELIDNRKIFQLPNQIWDSPNLDNRSLLRHSRTTLVRFGKQRWAVPIANPQFFMLIRNDVLNRGGLTAPETWQELVALKNKLADQDNLVGEDSQPLPVGIMLPSAKGWGAKVFLMMAASRIRQRGILSSLFDHRTMQPLINREPFVETLKELKLLVDGTDRLDPAGVVKSFFSGNSAIAIGWPSKAFLPEASASVTGDLFDHVSIHRVPGSSRWFDFANDVWRQVDGTAEPVELIGFDNRLASLLQSASHPTEGFEFLAWLASKQVGSEIFSGSSFGSPTRTSHLGNPQNWTGDVFNQDESNEFSDLFLEINEDAVFLLFPRIQGSQRYLDALEASIQDFLDGELEAEPALDNVANQWNQITDELDRQQQIERLRQDQAY